jgi:hypothetical protein
MPTMNRRTKRSIVLLMYNSVGTGFNLPHNILPWTVAKALKEVKVPEATDYKGRKFLQGKRWNRPRSFHNWPGVQDFFCPYEGSLFKVYTYPLTFV